MTKRRSFLIVDDDAAEREIMARTLLNAFPEAEVRQSDRPDEAEKICGDREPDCVIIDYNMPAMDGLTLSQKLRGVSPYLPLVLVTSVGDEMLAANALKSGVSDYIPKSRINNDSIHRTVARAIHVSNQARVIEEQRAELENFAYALAHDFKQPIRQIQTFAKLIVGAMGDHGDDEVRTHLGFLGDAARRLGSLVDIMSQYTLLSRPPEIGPCDLRKVMSEVRASIATYVDERRGVLVADGMPTVKGNETLMMQVIQNLVVNGLKYNKSDAPRVEITARKHLDRCLIDVKDNGIGIEPRFLKEIFKPLMRLHPAAEYPGSGLGLTLAAKAIIAQGGRIWCDSEIGAGSTFHLDLPLPTAMPAQAAA